MYGHTPLELASLSKVNVKMSLITSKISQLIAKQPHRFCILLVLKGFLMLIWYEYRSWIPLSISKNNENNNKKQKQRKTREKENEKISHMLHLPISLDF